MQDFSVAAGILTQVMLALQAVNVAAQWFAAGRHGSPPLRTPGALYNGAQSGTTIPVGRHRFGTPVMPAAEDILDGFLQ